MKGALISITPIHSIHHVCHLLPGVPHGIFSFLSKLAAQAKNNEKNPLILEALIAAIENNDGA